MKTILCTGQGWTEATQLQRFFIAFCCFFLLFLFHLQLFVVDVAVLCCFLIFLLQHQGPWHENATDQKWRHASGWDILFFRYLIQLFCNGKHKFSFYSFSSNILSNYSVMTLQTHEKKVKTYFQMEQPVCFSLGSGHVLELHHIEGKRSIFH